MVEEREITLQDALDHGLTAEEFASIQNHLGRLPNATELGMFSAMWSEHCSYKNSLYYLKKLPTQGSRTMTKAGEENAGALDIGDGLAVVFKVESHNHPSALEPYQGAATGVGGIMRDIFTMGARPIASLNSLRFGMPTSKRARHHLRGVVKGIGDYGNCLGVPTVAGEVFFDKTYEVNPLVNAMVVGVVRHQDIAYARAEGVGNPVLLIGSTTGRDGIHGASFASKDITKESEEKRSAVQVGDPFMEKLLLEATLELLQSGTVVGIQDMGAAGISCSTSEMSGKSNHGMRINLDKVPMREPGMSPYEIMLSESQERMLVVVHKGTEQQAIDIVKKWGLHAKVIGEVIKEDKLYIEKEGKLTAKIPAKALIVGGGAPVYQREYREPKEYAGRNQYDFSQLRAKGSSMDILSKMISSPNLASRLPVYDQYDHQVMLGTVVGPGSDAAVMRLHQFDTKKGLAATIDCNGRYVFLDPANGSSFAVAEAARNLACVGAEPLGVTNCLNFANPYIPENYFYFVNAIKGMSDACRAFSLPITGGNVSFYNESPEGPVFPTPTIGMVGLLDDIFKNASLKNGQDGDQIALVGFFEPTFGGSEYLSFIHNVVAGPIPKLNLEQEQSLQKFLLSAIRETGLRLAHDISDGGLSQAMLEIAFHSDQGFQIQLPQIETALCVSPEHELYSDLLMFGETGGAAIVVYPSSMENALQEKAKALHIPWQKLGQMGGKDIRFQENGKSLIDSELAQLREIWANGLRPYFDITHEQA